MSPSPPSGSGSFLAAVGSTWTSQILIQAMSVVTSVVLARWLGPEGRGSYALVLFAAANVVYLLNLGVSESTVYYLGKNAHPGTQIFGQNLYYAALASLVGAGLGAVAIELAGPVLFPGVPLNLLSYGLILIPLNLVFGALFPLLLGKQLIGRLNIVKATRSLAALAATLGFVMALGFGAYGAVAAEALSFFVVDAVLFVLVWRAVGGIAFRFNRSYLGDTLRYGVPVSLATLFQLLLLRADLWMLNLYHSAAAVGVYAVGMALVEKLVMFTEGVGSVLFARIAADQAATAEVSKTPLVLRAVVASAAAGGLVLFLAGGWLIRFLYSDRFAESLGPLQVLAIGVAARCGWVILDNGFKGRGLPGLSAAALLPALVVNLSLNLWWVPMHGPVGAAWASTCSMFVGFFLAVALYCRSASVPVGSLLLPGKEDLRAWLVVSNFIGSWVKRRVTVKPRRNSRGLR